MKRKPTESKTIEIFKGPTEKKSKDYSEAAKEPTPRFGEEGHTRYEDAFNEFIAEVIVESSKDARYDFNAVGENLVFFMRCCAEPRHFKRDYETECADLRNIYQVLMSRIEEIRKMIPKDVLALPINHFVRSIDPFIESS